MMKNFGVAVCISVACGGLLACSSTSSSPATTDGGGTVLVKPDAAGAVGDDGGTNPTSDAAAPGVGNACTSNTDCPNGGQCTNDSYKAGPLFPTPVCISTCTASTDPSAIASCGTQTNQGLCQAGQAGNPAICFPLCTVASSGAITGCLAHDVCQVLGTTTDPTTAAAALIGICQPGCTADSQCPQTPTASKCDTFQGACVTTVVPPTKPFGGACNPSTDTTCLCIGAQGATTGFCTSACTTGGTCPTAGAASGDGGAGDAGTASSLPFVCSAQLGGINSLDAGISFATQPPGLDGFCFLACDVNTDCASMGAGSTCNPDPAGGTHKGICTVQ